MKRILILGHTGTIGKHLISNSLDDFEDIIGISRHQYFESRSGLTTIKQLTKELSLKEIHNIALESELIINAAWTINNRTGRNNRLHQSHGQWEEKLIANLKGREIRYVSLGSIAELMPGELSTSYAQEKRTLSQHVQRNLENSLWLRVASTYGLHDRRNWFIPELMMSAKQGIDLKIRDSRAILNFVHVNELAKEILNQASGDNTGAINLYTHQWYRLVDVVKGFWADEEPVTKKSPVIGLFDEFDISAHQVHTPPLVETLKYLIKQI